MTDIIGQSFLIYLLCTRNTDRESRVICNRIILKGSWVSGTWLKLQGGRRRGGRWTRTSPKESNKTQNRERVWVEGRRKWVCFRQDLWWWWPFQICLATYFSMSTDYYQINVKFVVLTFYWSQSFTLLYYIIGRSRRYYFKTSKPPNSLFLT